MRLSKRLRRAAPVQSILAWLTAQYIRLLFLTTQWTVICPPETERCLAKGRPFIACFWHGRMIMMRAALPRGTTMHVLISEHSDDAYYLQEEVVLRSSCSGAIPAVGVCYPSFGPWLIARISSMAPFSSTLSLKTTEVGRRSPMPSTR